MCRNSLNTSGQRKMVGGYEFQGNVSQFRVRIEISGTGQGILCAYLQQNNGL